VSHYKQRSHSDMVMYRYYRGTRINLTYYKPCDSIGYLQPNTVAGASVLPPPPFTPTLNNRALSNVLY